MEKELNHLNYTLEKFDEVIADSNLKLSNLRELYGNNYEAMMEEKERLEHFIKSIEYSKQKPYFARIDFENAISSEKCYIGKIGVQDYDNNIITVDWRAPIASLYYDSNVGSTSYVAPEGIIKGTLKLKRQYTIDDAKLISYNDVDTVSNDELLKPYLGVNAKTRLKNIVSTIQSEQNKIIREDLNKNLVIQGVAGSGKTTVALHRIAYLVYNNRDRFKARDYMIIGPNKFFVKYISGILPDLDVNGCSEYTLEEVFENYLNQEFTINNSLDKIIAKNIFSNYKTSMKIKEDIDEYFSKLILIPNEDFCIYDTKILSKKTIENIFNEINSKYYKSVKAKIERLILLLNKHLDENSENIITSLIKAKVANNVISEFKNNLNFHLKKYFKILNLNSKNVYVDILKKLEFPHNISKNIIDIEDIPALIYIEYLLRENSIYDNYRHIVIDEAQDYGVFTFYVLKLIFKNATFSIYGDLAQSLYAYRSIDSWDHLKDIYRNIEILKLNKSYRTTIEIMEAANKINRKLNLTEAVPVIRHGEQVKYTKMNIIDLLNELKDKYQTIAVITKTALEASDLYQKLNNKIDLNLISSDNLNYETNINVLPSYLSKGLEFDVVIIIDTFDKEDKVDLKLLYVAMTRALHQLYIKEK